MFGWHCDKIRQRLMNVEDCIYMDSIRKLEADLWEAADLLRAESKLTSNQYCMPVLGLLFLRYAYSRFKAVEQVVLKDRPMRRGVPLPVEPRDFAGKNALYLPREAQYEYLVNLPEDVAAAGITDGEGEPLTSLGEVINNAMRLVEEQSEQLQGILPKNYDEFPSALLRNLLTNFNNGALDDVGGDVMGRIYEYFLNKFAKNIASDDGVFFTPKSLVKMIVNVIEPKRGVLLDPACGSGGMFVQTGDFAAADGLEANSAMTFYGQEKVEYNAKLCKMNMAVHGLTGIVKYGDEANTFSHDAHNLAGQCDYVMANPPFNVDMVNVESTQAAGRLPFGLPGINKKKKVFSNANYLWISYFYAYLNDHGRAGFVMASSATDSQNKDKDIREKLVETGAVDVMISVGNNFFYTLSLPCTLWFFDRGKGEETQGKTLFIDARNYYTVIDRTLNEWSEWQLRNLQAIVRLYRGDLVKYQRLLCLYQETLVKRTLYFGLEGFKATDFAGAVGLLEDYEKKQQAEAKEEIAAAGRAEKKAKKEAWADKLADIAEVVNIAKEAQWLYEKFGEGDYKDIPGLCRIATKEEIKAKGYSLTPGAYVGVAPAEDDGVDFGERMKEIHGELAKLNAEANALMEKITANLSELGV